MSLQTDSQTDAQQEDELRSALTNQYCRFVLHYFDNASENAASVADLSTTFARENDEDEDQVAVRLHHIALPKLSDVGVVDYDTRNKTVSYPGHSHLDDRLRIRESEPEYVVGVQ